MVAQADHQLAGAHVPDVYGPAPAAGLSLAAASAIRAIREPRAPALAAVSAVVVVGMSLLLRGMR